MNLNRKSVFFRIPVKSLDTGIDKRNRDMHKLMEVENYPYAEFKGDIVSDLDPDSEESQEVKVVGNFTLHGVERPIEVTGLIDRNGSNLHVETSFDILITEYNIKPPRFLANKVKDKHVILIIADMQEQKSEVGKNR